jgi:SSS family solute:Na+ symporter
MWAYATLGLGSALALFMYPHSVTATLSSGSRNTIRRNAAILPAYSFVLGLLALLGWVAIAAGTKPLGLDGKPNTQLVVPQLFEDFFPSWFAGVAFAAIAIGALVPAAIMSIAAANTFTRNVYKEWLKKDATPAEEARVSKLASLVVKAFALVFVLTLDRQNAINFQLLGGIWILQTFPAIVFSLYTRWFHRWGLLAGWAVGIVYGTVKAYQVVNPVTGGHFGGSLAAIPAVGDLGYIALTAFVLNLLVTVVVTLVLNAANVSNGLDATVPGDYYADAGDPRVQADLASTDDLTRGEPHI